MNKKGPLMYCHLGIMALLFLANAFFAVLLLAGIGSVSEESLKLHDTLRGGYYVLSTIVIIFGILYVISEYSKLAAHHYKTFLYLYAASSLVLAVIDAILVDLNFVTVFAITLFTVKAFLILILALTNDVGKKASWIIYYIALGVDIIGMVMMVITSKSQDLPFRIISSLSSLILEFTIALSIRGKYLDKEMRKGTKE